MSNDDDVRLCGATLGFIAMAGKSALGALILMSVLVLSSCSGSAIQQSGALPQLQQGQSVLRPAASTSVKITEYSVIRHPQNITIGPDNAVWFASATPNSSATIIYVYRFAANDGQGRYYALPSLIKPYTQVLTWGQQGPLISFAGRMWIAFEAHPSSYPFPIEYGGLVQMTANGTAVNANLTHTNELIAAGTVQGNRLWLLPGDQRNDPEPGGLASYTFENGALHLGRQFIPPFYPPNSFDFSYALRVGRDNNLYALTSDFCCFTGVYKISPNGVFLARYQLNRFHPVDMAFGPDGAMWITSAPYIIRMTTNGTRALYTIPYPGTSPAGITAGHDGAMWFIDAGTNAIGRITMAGAVTEYPVPTAQAFTDSLASPSIVACPVGVGACGSGDIWFLEQIPSKLGRVHF